MFALLNSAWSTLLICIACVVCSAPLATIALVGQQQQHARQEHTHPLLGCRPLRSARRAQ
jgi:ABC-type spermidine/putrescine transport system permease subunit II